MQSLWLRHTDRSIINTSSSEENSVLLCGLDESVRCAALRYPNSDMPGFYVCVKVKEEIDIFLGVAKRKIVLFK